MLKSTGREFGPNVLNDFLASELDNWLGKKEENVSSNMHVVTLYLNNMELNYFDITTNNHFQYRLLLLCM